MTRLEATDCLMKALQKITPALFIAYIFLFGIYCSSEVFGLFTLKSEFGWLVVRLFFILTLLSFLSSACAMIFFGSAQYKWYFLISSLGMAFVGIIMAIFSRSQI